MTEPPSGQLTYDMDIRGGRVVITTTGADHHGRPTSWEMSPEELDRVSHEQQGVAARGIAAQAMLDLAGRGEASPEVVEVVTALLLTPAHTTRVRRRRRA